MRYAEKSPRPNIAGFVAITLFIGTFAYLSVVISLNRRMEQQLQENKLELERLVSEKLLEQKRIVLLTKDLDALEKQCKDRTHLLDSLLEVVAVRSARP